MVPIFVFRVSYAIILRSFLAYIKQKTDHVRAMFGFSLFGFLRFRVFALLPFAF